MCKLHKHIASAAVMINEGGRIRLMTGCLDMLVILLLISVLQVETHWNIKLLRPHCYNKKILLQFFQT